MELLLLKLGIIKLSQGKIDSWSKKGKKELLVYALDKGVYHIREKAAIELGKINDPSLIDQLKNYINDSVSSVSIAAMDAIEHIGKDQLDDQLAERIKKQRKIWERKAYESQLSQRAGYQGKLIQTYSKDYERYILIYDITKVNLKKGIEEFGELSGDDQKEDFDFFFKELNDKWVALKFSNQIDFFSYHTLIAWLPSYSNDPEYTYSIGVAQHRSNEELSYYCNADFYRENGESLIGVFHSGQPLFIYLPEAFMENGNIMLTRDFMLPMSIFENTLLEHDLSLEKLDEGFEKVVIPMNVPK
ncbi:MAG: HEAT repeat domain-containing protein [Bacteroidota bacterium]